MQKNPRLQSEQGSDLARRDLRPLPSPKARGNPIEEGGGNTGQDEEITQDGQPSANPGTDAGPHGPVSQEPGAAGS